METIELRSKLHQYIDNADDRKLEAMYEILEEDLGDLNILSEPATEYIRTYNKDIDDAESEIENGKFFTHEEVEKQSKQWLNGK